jgi:hypothetical protein
MVYAFEFGRIGRGRDEGGRDFRLLDLKARPIWGSPKCTRQG